MPTLELPAVSASKEFLDALFDKHNIDGEQISSKSVVDKEFRQTLGSPQNNQLVEAISHAIVSHADQQRSDADAPFGSARAQRLLPPRGAPGGSGRVGLRRWRGRATGRPATAASGARARRLPKSPNAPMRFAVQAHSCIGSHGTEHGWFDERQHPLTEGAPPPQPSLAAVQGWLWTILDALKLDPECLILSLVLLERAPPAPPPVAGVLCQRRFPLLCRQRHHQRRSLLFRHYHRPHHLRICPRFFCTRIFQGSMIVL